MAVRVVNPEEENSEETDIETDVTVTEIENLLHEADLIEWSDAPRFTMLCWVEYAVDILQRASGQPSRSLI